MNDAWLKKTITLWVQILRIRVVIIQKNRHSRAYQETNTLLCHFPPWLEGKLLSSLTLLFHKQTNTDLLFLKHFTPHRPSSDPSSSPSVHSLSFPILFSSFLSCSPSHHLTSSLPTLDTIIYFLSSIWSILKTKVKPKIWLGAQISLCEVTGSGNRGGFAIIQIIASTWCKVNQATMQEQKGLISAVSRRAESRASMFTDLPAVLGNRLCSSSIAALWWTAQLICCSPCELLSYKLKINVLITYVLFPHHLLENDLHKWKIYPLNDASIYILNIWLSVFSHLRVSFDSIQKGTF